MIGWAIRTTLSLLRKIDLLAAWWLRKRGRLGGMIVTSYPSGRAEISTEYEVLFL